MVGASVQIYKSRWIVLALFMFPNSMLQTLWICFASVTSDAMIFYNLSDEFAIYLLSMTFMIVYIPVTFLASWLIDKYDFKLGAGIGAILTGVFGFLRIFTAGNFALILMFQIMLAIGQPFLMNSVTKLSANWFPESERTTATGIALVSAFVGNALGLFLTPFLVYISFQVMLLMYGALALTSSILFIVFAKNKPPTPPIIDSKDDEVFMANGLRTMFTNNDFLLLFIIIFIVFGVFNTFLTIIEGIILPKGHDSTFAGILGGIILMGGILGIVLFSILSDIYRKRKLFLIISIFTATISLFIISFTNINYFLIIFGFFFGFGIVATSPLALEYAVDVTSPVPESSSSGMLMVVGQIGGIIFLLSLGNLKLPVTGDFFPALIFQTILLAIALILSLFLKEKKNQ